MKTTNLNYIAYQVIRENAKWDHYAEKIPGSDSYRKLLNCSTCLAVHDIIENVDDLYFDEVLKSSKIYYTRKKLLDSFSKNELLALTNEYLSRFDPGEYILYTDKEWEPSVKFMKMYQKVLNNPTV